MPARGAVRVSDVPIDVLVNLIKDPDAYQPLIDGWQKAKSEAVATQERANEMSHEAEKRLKAAAVEEGDLMAKIILYEKTVAARDKKFTRDSEHLERRLTELAKVEIELKARAAVLEKQSLELKEDGKAFDALQERQTEHTRKVNQLRDILEQREQSLTEREAKMNADMRDLSSRIKGFQLAE